MKTLVALVLLAASAPPPVAAPAQPPTHAQRERVQVSPNLEPQEFTVDCPRGKRVLSGGFGAVPALRVTGSSPTEGRESWSVRVLNPTKVVQPLVLTVLCGDLDTVVVSAPATSVRCPNATVATGGGFVSAWMPSQGGAAITGSYPLPGTGWGIDMVQLPAAPDARAAYEVRTFAVCGRGLMTPPEHPARLFETAATGTIGCSETLTGGGFRLISTPPPGFLVTEAMPTEDQWRVSAEGRGDGGRALAMRVTAVCVSLPPAAASPSPTTPVVLVEPIAESRDLLPVLVAGVGAVVVALLLLVVALSTRSRGRDRRRAPQAQVSVVVRSHRSAFRMGEMREVR